MSRPSRPRDAELSPTIPTFPVEQTAWPAGESPYRARGLLYQGALDFFAEHVPGGAAAVRAALPASLRPFASQMFIPSVMFDLLPIVAITAAAARVASVPHLDFVRENARWMAERDLRGVHKLLLGVLSPSTVAQRLPRAAIRYFDFGEAEAELSTPTTLVARQHDIPAFMAAWYAAAVEGFVPVPLSRAGARNVRVRVLGCTRDVPIMHPCTIVFEFTWT